MGRAIAETAVVRTRPSSLPYAQDPPSQLTSSLIVRLDPSGSLVYSQMVKSCMLLINKTLRSDNLALCYCRATLASIFGGMT